MRAQPQITVIALSVIFAMVLAVSVALIGFSYAGEEAVTKQPQANAKEPSDTASESQPNGNTGQTPSSPATGAGLLFTDNGDGTCVLTGIGACTDACVVIPEYDANGNRVTSIAPSAFYGCTTVTAIQIPSSVRVIGSLAFAACPNLVYISVSAANPYFLDMDGVLYSADESTLILYPAMRAGNTVHIRAVTTKISDMAFYNCRYLTHVTFEGTPDAWEVLSIGSKNYSLTAASKTFEPKV